MILEVVPSADIQVTLGGEAVPEADWIEDWFAPAQFDRLEPDDSLSAPSYEMMTAGVRFGDEGVSLSADAACTSVSREPAESTLRIGSGGARRSWAPGATCEPLPTRAR